MFARLWRMVGILDEPIADPASLNVLFISELARRHGIKVLLSGVGGDDLTPAIAGTVCSPSTRSGGWVPPSLRRASEKPPR